MGGDWLVQAVFYLQAYISGEATLASMWYKPRERAGHLSKILGDVEGLPRGKRACQSCDGRVC